ncbi:MAG TPA: iron ABC transporter substrate-binding protein [Lachnospiraceae bacterium]|nr:iron ABC transporter substrate-binding protein [Lachnospiraceae bacterium]
MAVSAAACGSSGSSGDAERKDAQQIKEENQISSGVSQADSGSEAAETSSGAVESSASETSGTASETGSSETASEAESGKKTEYPLTITTYDSEGNEIETTYEKAPEKVLAVYQGCIETMLALGLEDRMAAAAGLDNEVPEELKSAFSKVEYLDEFTPSLETVTMMEPDMIFSWGSLFGEKTLGSVTDWLDKGCNTYYSSNTRPGSDTETRNRTLENEYTDILNIGQIFDVQDQAEAIVADIKGVIDQTIEATKDLEERPSVLILEPLGDSITNYGASSLGGDMVTKLGAQLANSDAKTVGKEDIIAANPDVIFVVYMPYAGDDPETVKETQLATIRDDEALQSLDAVKNGRIVPIMLSEMYASATRTQDGIEHFAAGLYPELNQ